MEFREPKLLFDAADYELVRAVDEAVAGYRARGGRPPNSRRFCIRAASGSLRSRARSG